MIGVGTIIDDKYEVTGRIGHGGFGAVYAAVQQQLGRKVAIKTINTTLLQEPDGLARFEREAKAISTLLHKNVVGFYGYGVWRQAPYMVMELVEGTALGDLIRKEGKLDPMRALRLTKQICEALAAAHAAGIVHRDLKPANILVVADAESETIKIIDFGLAKLMPGYGIPGQKLTETGYAFGTCHYMSPEQALGGVVDHRVDIYAVGCILYEMLTAVRAFDAEENIAILYQHINEQPKPLSGFLPKNLPIASLSTLIENCMAKEPADRYPECADVIADIDAILSGKLSTVTPLAVRPMKSLHRPPRATKLSKKAVAVALGTLAVIGGEAWFAQYQNNIAAQVEEDRRVAQVILRERYRSDDLISRKRLIHRILKRDERFHHLQPSERFAFLTLLAGLEQAHPYVDQAWAMHEQVPVSDWIWLKNIGNVYEGADEWDNALAVYKVLKEKANTHPEWRYWAETHEIKLYADKGDLDKALALAQAHVSNIAEHTNIAEANTLLGHIYLLTGNLAKARAAYQQALTTSRGGAPDAGLARVAYLEGDYDKAIQFAKHSLQTARQEFGKPNLIYEPAAAVLFCCYTKKGQRNEEYYRDFRLPEEAGRKWADNFRSIRRYDAAMVQAAIAGTKR